MADDLVALKQSANFPLQDMATADMSHAVVASDPRPNEEAKRKSPPPAPKKKTHFVGGFGLQEDGRTNSADALRMRSPVIVELRTNVIVCASISSLADR
jgi:hypothetical protein